MKFNNKELAIYGANKLGQADKEGVLWMRESDSVVKKKENYYKRWFILSGNLLFYTKEDFQESPLAGVIVLERAKVESEAFSGNRNAFRLTFKNSEGGYWFFADSARETDEWIRILNCASYEYLRVQFSELRGQLMHLTGKDPLGKGSSLTEWSLNITPTLPSSAPGYDGDPMFELSLSCSSLVGGITETAPPSPLIITHCMTPPQAYWIRYAQTELVEHSCDPQFITPVVFFDGSIFSATQLKFDVFDVCNQQHGLMRPLGQCQCIVMDLVKEPDQLNRLEIKFDDKISGYLVIKTVMCSRRSSSASNNMIVPKVTNAYRESSPLPESIPSFSFRSPINNIVVRKFEFPVRDKPGQLLQMTEVMGEGLFTFSLPMQIIEMCIAEENATIGQFSMLTGLSEHWEIIRQEVVLELRHLVEHYWKAREALQLEAESGKLFKKSIIKDNATLEFVPVNLHVQEMKVAFNNEDKERVLYTCVTVGCPTAYSLKFRQGGLARIQSSIPRLGTGGSFSPATENKTYRVKHLLNRISQHQIKIKNWSAKLTSAAEKGNYDDLKECVHGVVESVAILENHCKGTLVKDALRDWYKALDINHIPSFISSLTTLEPISVLAQVEQHMVCIEAQVDGVINSSLSAADCSSQLKGPISEFLQAIDQTIEVFQTSLFFILLREFYLLQVSKCPVGLKGYRHRRDIVFSHTVTSAVSSFVMKVLRSIGSKHFLTQIQELGFLIHWESLLSTAGDEIGMLEDFIVAIHDLNALKFKFVLATSVNDLPRCQGGRYKAIIEVPLQSAIYRILPAPLKDGKEINTVAVLFTVGINEQQSIADTFGDSHLQDQINLKSLQRLTQYCDKFRERFGTAGMTFSNKAKTANNLLHQLRTQIHTRKTKNTDILTLSSELCRVLECGRITSCKSAKDRTAMSVTLEQAHILLSNDMEPSFFQQSLDMMRSQGTRIRNAEKNIGVPSYAFNAIQVVALPKFFRPPEGTYKKLQT